jgi:RNA polymerase sigma factor (sigma-70 family)
MAARLDSVLHYVRKVLGTHAELGSDADLLHRFVKDHDETAFELVMWRHAAMVLRVCQSILRDCHAAEDAFQATFLALARKAASISRRESLAAWLYQVAYHVSVRARHSAVRRRALEARRDEVALLARPRNPRDEAAERDLVPLVHEELNQLSAKYRTPIVLCYLEGKTHAEAAQQLGWAKGTVSGRLARGREMLKKRLVRRGVLFPTAALGVALTASKASAVPPALVSATIHAAVAFAAGNAAAAGVSTGVIHLTHGVLQAMCFSKIKATTAAVFAFVLIFAGVGSLIRIGLVEMSANGAAPPEARYYPPPRSIPSDFEPGGEPGDLGGSGLLGDPPPGFPPPAAPGGRRGPSGFPGGPGSPGGMPTPAKGGLLEQKHRIDSSNNLKQIALAFHSYHDANGAFPRDITDDEGRPLLSWRVAILPYIDEGDLYKQFNRDEAWDSPHNRKLLSKMPALYRLRTDSDIVPNPLAGDDGPDPRDPERIDLSDPQRTYYQGFAGKRAMFEQGAPRRLGDITDGTSNTILIVEAANAVPWSKPQDLLYSAQKAIPALGVFPEVIHAVFADGMVHKVRRDFDQKEMRKAIVINDGQEIDFDKLELPPKAAAGPPGMGRGPGAGMPGMGPGDGPGALAPNANLRRLQDENAKLEQVLQQTAEEMQALRDEMAKVKERFAMRQEQVEAKKLLAERERLRQQLQQAQEELKAMRDELQRLKRALDQP